MKLAAIILDGEIATGRVEGDYLVLADDSRIELSKAEFAPPISSSSKIICVGVNYMAHMREMGRPEPEYPLLFTRFPDTLVGHDQTLFRPANSSDYDFEGELAVVIGGDAHHVKREDALECVAGYTCFMDGSLRDYQHHTTQVIAGKNFWRSGACGPWMVTADEIPDPSALNLQTRLNGEVVQSAPVSDLKFNVPYLIEYISSFCPLRTGDIISTGTPSGVGYARDPQLWMQPGDTIEVEIDGIGTLRNAVAAEP